VLAEEFSLLELPGEDGAAEWTKAGLKELRPEQSRLF
jgi:hypothetical protein